MPRHPTMPGLVDQGSSVIPSHLDQEHMHLHGSSVDLDWSTCILMSSSRARWSRCRPSSRDFPSTCSTGTRVSRVKSCNFVVHDVRNLGACHTSCNQCRPRAGQLQATLMACLTIIPCCCRSTEHQHVN